MNTRTLTALAITAAAAAIPCAVLTAKPVRAAFVWQNVGQPEPTAAALAVASGDGVVAATGNVCDDPESSVGCNWFVRAMNPRTGATLWEDRVDAGGFDRSQAVVVDCDRVIASGWFQVPVDPVTRTGGFDFVVRAYAARTGVLLWQQRLDRGPSDFVETLAAADGRVFAVGRVRGASGGSDFTIVAFDAATGEELWESVTDVFQFDAAFQVVAEGRSVFVAGPVRNLDSVLVRAYNARTGAIRWENEIQDGQMSIAEPNRLAVKNGTLYLACAIITPTGDQDALVRAYDQRTGSIVWTAQWDGGGNDEAFGLAPEGDQLFVVGEDGMNADFLAGFRAVRALDRRTGLMRWHDSFQLAPGGDAFATTVATSGRTVATGGWVQDAAGRYTWSLRTYDARTGALVDRDEGDVGGLNSLAENEGRFFAAGFVGGDASSPAAFAVRAYHFATAHADR